MRRTLVPLAVILHFAGFHAASISDAWSQESPPALPRPRVGVVVPPVGDKPQAPRTLESKSTVLDRAAAVHSRESLIQLDMTAEGVVTVYGVNGADAVFPVTLQRSGPRQSQQVKLTQADGKPWDGRVHDLAPGGVRAMEFLQTQHDRGPLNLLLAESKGSTVLANQTKDTLRVVTVRDEEGRRTTHYFLDGTNSRLRRMEYISGVATDETGASVLIYEAYVFSDYRDINGVSTPHQVEHFTNGVRREGLRIQTARYAAASGPALPAGGTR